ncbi:MAG: ABC transporter ATP-binding protein [Polyangia bacterium]
MPGARVDIRNITKTFELGGRVIEVLRGVDLTLEAGAMVAVVGSSGAGKSTLLHVLGALDLPTAGTVAYDGVPLASMSRDELARFRNRTIGFVFQFHHLLPDFTALENCAMPGLIARLDSATAQKRAAALLDRVGLSKRLDHRPGELSGGEQQRVALARALLLEPRMLLADEPTGNLDSQTGDEIHELMVELNRERGMTMLVVTHNKQMASRLPLELYMADGRLVERPAQVQAP